MTGEELRRLADAVDAYRRGELSDGQFLQAMAITAPALRKRLRKTSAWSRQDWLALANLVGLIVQLVLPFLVAAKSTRRRSTAWLTR